MPKNGDSPQENLANAKYKPYMEYKTLMIPHSKPNVKIWGFLLCFPLVFDD
jgi:hypothetical protein